MALSPSPQRQNETVFRTPNTQDSLFFEIHQASAKERSAVPTYGEAYPLKGGAASFPNHRLCFIEPAVDAQGLFEKWWYVEDLTSQEAWNGSWNYPYGGSPRYPRVSRNYTLRREEGELGIALGTADPGGSIDGMAVTLADGTPVTLADGTPVTLASLGTPIMVAHSEQFLPGEIGSLYVSVTRVFDVIPGVDDVVPGSGEGQKEWGYEIEYPLGGHEFIQLTWTITLPRLIAQGLKVSQDGTNPDTLTPCPIDGYTNLLLVEETITASSEENQTSKVVRVYRGNRAGESFPSSEAKVQSEKRYEGTMPPAKFIANIIEYSIFSTVIPGVDDFSGSAGDGYFLISVGVNPESSIQGEKKLTYAAPVIKTLRGLAWDDNLETFVPYTVEALPLENGTVYRENDAGVAVADSVTGARNLVATPGEDLTISPYNANWAIVTREMPVPTAITPASANFPAPAVTRYGGYPHSWPAVINSATAAYAYFVNTDSGANGFYISYEMLHEARSELSKAKFQVAYSITNPIGAATELPIDYLAPTAMALNWPVADFGIPECLHPQLGPISESFYGTSLTKTFPATTLNGAEQTDWPLSLCVVFDAKPYKNGYLVRRIDVYKPSSP